MSYTAFKWFKPSSKIFLLTVPRWLFFCGSFVFFVSCVSHAFASVYCCLVVTCWERVDLLALVGDVYCHFVIFPCGVPGQVWHLIVSFPDLCRLSYLHRILHAKMKYTLYESSNILKSLQKLKEIPSFTRMESKLLCKSHSI